MRKRLASFLLVGLLVLGVSLASSQRLPASATGACSGCEITAQTQLVPAGGGTTGIGSFMLLLGPTPLGNGRAWLFMGSTVNFNVSHTVHVDLTSSTGYVANLNYTLPAWGGLSAEVGAGQPTGTYMMRVWTNDGTAATVTLQQLFN